MRKALLLVAALAAVTVATTSAQAAPPPLFGCNNPDAVINFEQPWACDFPE